MPLRPIGDNGLYVVAIREEEGEWVGFYRPGGHHPVHIGDFLGDQKEYRVIAKLGVGCESLIWLCRVHDSEPVQYVAVKINTAEYSDATENRELEMTTRLQEIARCDRDIAEYCCLPLDTFRIKGPIDTHQMSADDPDETLRSLTRQVVLAMAALHRNGICYGDFRPDNNIIRVDLTDMAEEEVIRSYFGDETARVEAKEGYNIRPHAPDYIVFPREKCIYYHDRAIPKIWVVDWEDAHFMSDRPKQGRYYEPEWAPPELMLEVECDIGKSELTLEPGYGAAGDIWAVACTIFKIRTGFLLFGLVSSTMNEAFQEFISLLGLLPEP
ncbi:kinase-like domain-containing protein [Aspergillus pseudoustus]|uniref:non-specific serine/threonine protein kinase n=1 Tax=Aspergillus pseudoustus TaxID=1810923 RepID=A0ABR4JBY5_9EURO